MIWRVEKANATALGVCPSEPARIPPCCSCAYADTTSKLSVQRNHVI